jgi:hypothetical protein
MMSTDKEDVEALLTKLPDYCSLEDIQYHLYVIDKVRHGLEVADLKGQSRRKKPRNACRLGLQRSLA